MRILLAMTLVGASVLAIVPALAETGQSDPAAAAKAPITAAEGKVTPAAPAPTAEAPAAGAAATAAAVAPPKPKPVAPVIVANIDLAAQRMTVSVGGKPMYSWPVSSGLPGYATPRGSFTPTWLDKMHYSKQYDDAPMPHSVFFKDGVAVHGTYAQGALGRPASHGCVRVSLSNAATFFNLVSKHGVTATRVIVRGDPPAPRVASRRRDRDNDDGWFNDRPSRRAEARSRSRYPGDEYAWSGSSRGPSWSRF